MIANPAGRLEQGLFPALRLELNLSACNIQCPESVGAVWSLKTNVRKVHRNRAIFCASGLQHVGIIISSVGLLTRNWF